MGESLTQRRRVSEEGLRVVKLCQRERILLVTPVVDGTLEGSTG